MTKQTQTQPQTKKTYTPPQLVRYGDMRALTQAGSSGTLEGPGKEKPKLKP